MGTPLTLIETTNVSLTTAAAAVTAPADMNCTATYAVCGAVSSGAFVTWRRQKASDSTYSALCHDSKTSINVLANNGQTPFFAKVPSGTATLEVEWWG